MQDLVHRPKPLAQPFSIRAAKPWCVVSQRAGQQLYRTSCDLNGRRSHVGPPVFRSRFLVDVLASNREPNGSEGERFGFAKSNRNCGQHRAGMWAERGCQPYLHTRTGDAQTNHVLNPHAVRFRLGNCSGRMQDTLKALADMRVWQEVERETVEGRDAQRITAEAAQASLKSHQHRRKTIEARRPCYSTGITMSSGAARARTYCTGVSPMFAVLCGRSAGM